MIRFTIITSSRPTRLAKAYHLDGFGALAKQGAGAVTAGRAEVATIDTLAGLAETLIGLAPNQAVTWGLPAESPVDLVTRETWAGAGKPAGMLPRTNETFGWPSGPGVMMLDHDPAAGTDALSRDDLVAAIRGACPGLTGAAMLWWCSASSHIIDTRTDTGEDLTGLRGQRLYILVADARDSPRAGAALVDHLWASGHGHVQVSKSGALLERTIIDASVWQPSRLDFAAGAVCAAPLAQARGAPVLIPGGADIIDTREAIPDPDPATRKAAEAAKAAAKRAKKAEAEDAREIWLDEVVEGMVGPSASTEDRDHARRIAAGVLERRTLAGDFPIVVVADGRETTITTGDALDNPGRWHGALTLDPLEPDYDGRRTVGMLYLMGSRPRLYSFAHGGTSYTLARQPERIEIVRGRSHTVAQETLRILRTAPDMFDFGGALAHVCGGRVRPLDEGALTYHLGALTQYWRWHQPPKGDPVPVDEDPPARVVKMVLSLGDARDLKGLEAVITAPTIRTDGTVVQTEGYDQHTGLLLEPSDDLVPVPEVPTRDQVVRGVERLMTPFRDFPLPSAVDRGVLLATILTAAARPALPTAPAFAFDAPRQGSGKTLMASAIGALASGETPTIWPHTAGRDDEEVRKRLTTVLRTGDRALIWDNVVGTFDSAALAGALTAPTFADRILGKSETVSFPNRTLLLMTGNNLTLAGDLVRRVLVCRIDPAMERPWLRQFDLEPVAWVLARRQAMVSAALTLIRGWLTSGATRAPGCTASFEDWDRMVRQIVAWIGRDVFPGRFADPMDAIAQSAEADPDEAALCALLVALRGVYGDSRFEARDVAEVYRRARERPTYDGFGNRIEPVSPAERDVADALEDLAPTVTTARGIGRLLTFRRDRIVAGLRLVIANGGRPGTSAWRVEVSRCGSDAISAA